MLWLSMKKVTKALNKIELLLEERFSKNGDKYEAGSFRLNNGNDVKLYLSIAFLRDEIVLDLSDKNFSSIHLATISNTFHQKKIDSTIKRVEKAIKHIDNISKHIESINNVASSRFKVSCIDGNISENTIIITAKSVRGSIIGISGDFTKDTDYFNFEASCLIGRKNVGFFTLSLSNIKNIISQSDLKKACVPYYKPGMRGYRFTPFFKFYY